MAIRIIHGDCREMLKSLPDESVHCCVTSPPYFGLRDYGVDGQIGLEPTPEEFSNQLVQVFREVRRVLRKDGTLWLNLGDSYAANGSRANNNGEGASTMGWPGQRKETLNKAAKMQLPPISHGCKAKDLIGVPWLVAFALRADGWYLRQDIIWSKPNPMPESVRDRCTKAHEYIFLLSKSASYYYDQEAIREPIKDSNTGEMSAAVMDGYRSLKDGYTERRPQRKVQYKEIKGANRRSVWEVTTQPFSLAHFATFPPALIEPCIKAGCPVGGTVLDPFGGAGTTGLVADRLQRNAILIELNPQYAAMAERRIFNDAPLFAEAAE
jgi:DNA modification methylase